jgi:hypothetical protein
MIKRSCILALLLLALVNAEPALASIIEGRVTDAKSGEGLPFVSVLINGDSDVGDDIRRGVASDDRGFYRLPSIPAGTYKIRFVYVGYRERTDSLTVEANRTYTLNAGLEVLAFVVDEVVVEADRIDPSIDIQPSTVVIDKEVIDAIPAIGEPDPIRSLQLLPGVQAASDISSGLYIRGGGPDQNLILLDGAPVYNPTHAFGFFSTFNSDAIAGVTLYKGAYPAEHGGRLGSVLEVASRETTNNKTSGTIGVSTIAARALLEGPNPIGNGYWQFGARRTYLEPLLDAIRTPENPIPSYFFYDLNGKIASRFLGGQLVLTGYTGRDDLRIDASTETFIDLIWGNTVIAATFTKLLGDNALMRLSLSGSEYESITDASIFSTSIVADNRLRDLTLRGDITWTRFTAHRIRTGFQASAYDFSFDQRFNRDQSIDFQSQPEELSIYVDDEWKIRTGTLLRVGLRGRYITDGERYLLEPRGAWSQRVGNAWRFKVAGGVYNQYLQLVATEGLSAGDFFLPIDETAEMGQSVQGVVGIEFTPIPAYRFSIEAYYTDLANLVVLDNTTAADQTEVTAASIFHTGGEGYATGLEFFAERRIGNITGWVGYTLGWTRRRFDQLNLGRVFPPKYDRRHDINFIGQYRRGKWRYGAAFVYGTGQAFTAASARYQLRDPSVNEFPTSDQLLAADRNSSRLLPYHRLDVSVARSFSLFGLPAEWNVQIFNLYSRRNEWFIQYNTDDVATEPEVVRQLPIIPSLGVRFEF